MIIKSAPHSESGASAREALTQDRKSVGVTDGLPNERCFHAEIIPRKAGPEVSFSYPKNIIRLPNHDSQDSRINMIQFGRGSQGILTLKRADHGFMDLRISRKKPTSQSLGRGILSSVKSAIKSFGHSASSFSRSASSLSHSTSSFSRSASSLNHSTSSFSHSTSSLSHSASSLSHSTSLLSHSTSLLSRSTSLLSHSANSFCK